MSPVDLVPLNSFSLETSMLHYLRAEASISLPRATLQIVSSLLRSATCSLKFITMTLRASFFYVNFLV